MEEGTQRRSWREGRRHEIEEARLKIEGWGGVRGEGAEEFGGGRRGKSFSRVQRQVVHGGKILTMGRGQ